MPRLKLAFLGGRILGYQCLKMLPEFEDSIDVRIIIAHRNDGEKGSEWNPQLLPIAKKMGYRVFEPETLSNENVIRLFREEKIDVILNPFCNRIIPKKILDIPKHGTINFHYGKLPKYRGRFIVTHTILNEEKVTFATAHFMEADIDAGDIIFEEPVEIYPADTAKSLYFKCTEAATKLFRKVLEYLVSGKKLPHKKQIGDANYYPFDPPNNCQVDLTWEKGKIERFIRAVSFPPISYPWCEINGKKFKIILEEQNK